MIGKIAAVVTMFTFALNIVDFRHIEYFYYTSAILVIIATIIYIKKAVEAFKISKQ
jgi:hypothetical protein